eukprot:9471452-Lingulodinium_polyedra.AAC.1
MMRSNRPSAAATPRISHASHTPCEHQKRRSHGAREGWDLRAAVAADGRLDRIIVQRLRHATRDAVAIAARGRDGSLIARS